MNHSGAARPGRAQGIVSAVRRPVECDAERLEAVQFRQRAVGEHTRQTGIPLPVRIAERVVEKPLRRVLLFHRRGESHHLRGGPSPRIDDADRKAGEALRELRRRGTAR